MNNRWQKWVLLEAATKVFSKLLQALIGKISLSIGHVFFASLTVSCVQTILSGILIYKKGLKIFVERKQIIGAVLFGLGATSASVLSFLVFYFGGEISVNTFLLALSIVPGALIDRFFFKDRMGIKEWIGILLAILAGYSVLGWPNLSALAHLPLWIWLSLTVSIVLALNEAITRNTGRVEPLVQNFWGGLTMATATFLLLTFSGSLNLLTDFSPAMRTIWLSSFFIGINVILMWSFKVTSYKDGALLAPKNLLMYGTYLTTAMLLGTVFFGESLSVAKIFGVILYLIAYIFTDKSLQKYIKELL